MASSVPDPADLAALEWYHSIDVAPGVTTPGWQDTRPIAGRLPWPGTLAGLRCLDVGTFDGFWAFEMERRGAAEVVAIDILDPRGWDWPAGSDEAAIAVIGERKRGGEGFEVVRRALGSSVRRVERSVYDLDPAEDGHFDLVFVGSLLIHLRDPVRALERVRAVCAGTLISMDGIDLELDLLLPRRPVATLDGRGRPWWWHVNRAGQARLLEAAGFEVTRWPERLFIPPGAGQPLAGFSPRLFTSRLGRQALIHARRGDPHAVAVARPRSGLR